MTSIRHQTRKFPQFTPTRRGRPKTRADLGPTPETAAKLEPDVLLTLRLREEMSAEHEAAWHELHAMWRALKRGMLPHSKVKLASPIPGRKQVRSPFAHMNDTELEVWARRYKPWADAETKVAVEGAPRLTRLELARRIIAESKAPTAVGATYGLPPKKIIEHLRKALERYGVYRREKLLLHEQ